jgi:hypothetical protein
MFSGHKRKNDDGTILGFDPSQAGPRVGAPSGARLILRSSHIAREDFDLSVLRTRLPMLVPTRTEEGS